MSRLHLTDYKSKQKNIKMALQLRITVQMEVHPVRHALRMWIVSTSMTCTIYSSLRAERNGGTVLTITIQLQLASFTQSIRQSIYGFHYIVEATYSIICGVRYVLHISLVSRTSGVDGVNFVQSEKP